MFGTTAQPLGNMSPVNVKEADHGSHQFNSPIWAILIFLVFIFIVFIAFAFMFNRRRDDGGENVAGLATAATVPLIAAAATRSGGNHCGWGHEWEIEHDIMENRYISAKEHGETQKLIVVQGKDNEIQGLKNTQVVLDKIAESERRREEDARRKAEAEAIAAKNMIQTMMWFGAKPATAPAHCGGYAYADGYPY
ncbi:MAG: hypothetical protein FWH07_04960 [Oscillospiraceae bacterium]|nr:hypothetical protein [Oscillospiraceae bacterium]